MSGEKLIFFLPQIYPTYTGGLEIFAYYFVRNFSKIKSIIIVSDTKLDTPDTKQIPAWNRAPRRFFILLRLLTLFFRFHGKEKIYYISYATGFHWSWMIAFYWGSRIFKFRYVITVHSGKIEQWHPYWVFRNFFSGASALTAVSEKLCKIYREKTGMETIFTPPLIPFEKSQESKESLQEEWGVPKNSRVVLYLGSLKPLKSPETILEAALLLGRDFIKKEHLFFFFAGSGELEKKLRDKLSDSWLAEHVKLAGNVKREKISDLFKLSEFYVSASEYEGLSISLLEAMFNHMNIVVADSPGLNTVINHGKNGLLFQFGNSEELAKQLRFALSNKPLCEIMAKKAEKQYLETFSYSQILREWTEIFNSVQQRSSR